MKILITGATGLLGSYLVRTADPRDELHTWRFDITNEVMTEEGFQGVNPDMVIHCAGEGRVDYAEQYPQESWEINCAGTVNVIREALRCKAHFVFVSSNAVFGGTDAPYQESAIPSPRNRYGGQKAGSEALVWHYPHRVSIIRPILLYGWPPRGKRDNFVTRLLKAGTQEGVQIPVAYDIQTQPTYACDAAQAIWQLVKQQTADREIYHVAPHEAMSLYSFAMAVTDVFGLNPSLVTPVEHRDLAGLAPRPRDTTYCLDKLDGLGVRLRDAREGLLAMREEAAL